MQHDIKIELDMDEGLLRPILNEVYNKPLLIVK